MNTTTKQSGVTILMLLVMVMIFFTCIWGAFYIFKVGRRAVTVIGNQRSNDIATAENFLLLTSVYDVSPINPDTGEVIVEIPNAIIDSYGRWEVWRSTNLIDFETVMVQTTDQASAQLLVYDAFTAETNMNGMLLDGVFFGASRK